MMCLQAIINNLGIILHHENAFCIAQVSMFQCITTNSCLPLQQTLELLKGKRPACRMVGVIRTSFCKLVHKRYSYIHICQSNIFEETPDCSDKEFARICESSGEQTNANS